MKSKIYFFCFVFAIYSVIAKSQIYTPDYTIQGSSGNNNVGIGIASPQERLHVYNSSGSSFIHAQAAQNYGLAGIKLTASFNGTSATSQIYMDFYGINGQHGLHYVSGRSTLDHHWFQNASGTVLMSIKGTGKVGINTDQPLYNLDVRGNFRVTGEVSLDNKMLYLKGAQGTEFQTIFMSGYGYAHGCIFWKGDERTFTLNTGDGPQNMGAYGGLTLKVNGGILCESVQVIEDVPNSDFVFNSNYKLMSLPEIEVFINKNKHLPDIPSSEDFKKNGYSVGKMDDMLLRKVEELTLLMIEQDKTIKELKAKIKTLEK